MKVSENTSRPYTRWLGIYFDKTLSFKWHFRTLTEKAMKVADALRCLMYTSRGAPPSLIRQTVQACVIPIALIGAEKWWPCNTKTIADNWTVSNWVLGHLNFIHKVFLAYARAILPVYRTTPTPAPFREAGLLPPDLQLDKRSRQAIIRAYRLDPQHPLRKRISWSIKTRRKISRLSRWTLAVLEVEYIDPLINPWAIT